MPDWLALAGHALLAIVLLGVWVEVRAMRRGIEMLHRLRSLETGVDRE